MPSLVPGPLCAQIAALVRLASFPLLARRALVAKYGAELATTRATCCGRLAACSYSATGHMPQRTREPLSSTGAPMPYSQCGGTALSARSWSTTSTMCATTMRASAIPQQEVQGSLPSGGKRIAFPRLVVRRRGFECWLSVAMLIDSVFDSPCCRQLPRYGLRANSFRTPIRYRYRTCTSSRIL